MKALFRAAVAVTVVLICAAFVLAVAAIWADDAELQDNLGQTCGVLLMASVVPGLGAFLLYEAARRDAE